MTSHRFEEQEQNRVVRQRLRARTVDFGTATVRAMSDAYFTHGNSTFQNRTNLPKGWGGRRGVEPSSPGWSPGALPVYATSALSVTCPCIGNPAAAIASTLRRFAISRAQEDHRSGLMGWGAKSFFVLCTSYFIAHLGSTFGFATEIIATRVKESVRDEHQAVEKIWPE